MKMIKFPNPFSHNHPPVQDVNVLLEQRSTLGQRVADWVVIAIGSWGFILGQSALLVVWILLNILAFAHHWDPYPFILMNLFLSLQAAYTAPIIMMSQNRQNQRDRLEAHNDYLVNQKAEIEVRAIMDHLAAQDQALQEIYQLVAKLQGNEAEDD
jgi:uncharacterized membrane protein